MGGTISAELGWGVLMAIGTGIFFAWASNAAVRDLPDLAPIGRSAVTFCGAALFAGFIFLGSLGLGWREPPREITHEPFGLLTVCAVAVMALSQILFIASVGRLGIALSRFHINIAPFYVMVILIALGGSWDWRVALGAALVGLGAVIAQSGRSA